MSRVRKSVPISIVLVFVSVAALCGATDAMSLRWTSDAQGGVVQVTDDGFQGHVEPDVSINPHDPTNLLGACQFERGTRQRLPGTFASFDGGRSWSDNGLLPLPHGYEQGADTTVAFARSGAGYVAALMWHGGNGAASRVTRGGIFLWTTNNGGRSFSKPVTVFVGAGFQDHPWLALRNTPRGTVLYLAWANRTGLVFTRSHPGTTVFAPARVLVPGSAPSTPVIATGPGRNLEIFYQVLHLPTTGGKLRPFSADLAVLTSRDDGRTFGRVQTLAHVTVAVGAGGQQPPPLLTAAADPNTPVSAVAIAAQQPRAGHPVIELWQQHTATGRWHGPSQPVTGGDATLAQQQPRLVYANGHLYLSYFTVARDGATRERLLHAPSAAAGFTPQALPSPPFTAKGFFGDYQALAVGRDRGYALWNATRSGRLQIVAARFPVRL